MLMDISCESDDKNNAGVVYRCYTSPEITGGAELRMAASLDQPLSLVPPSDWIMSGSRLHGQDLSILY